MRHIFELRAVFALLLLPNRPRLYCRVSGLVLRRVPTRLIKNAITRALKLALYLKKQGRIHGNPVADGWAGAVMRKPLAILEIFPTDRHGKV